MSNFNETMQRKAIAGAKTFLKSAGYEPDEFMSPMNEEAGWLAFQDDDELVICRVAVVEEYEDELNRREFEAAGFAYLMEKNDFRGRLRFDDIQLRVVGTDRAMLRHQTNCIGFAD